MAISVLITLTTAGAGTGPFDLYSDVDGYTTPFETNVSKAALEAGYYSGVVPDAATIIRVTSLSVDCPNYVDLVVPPLTTTTTSTTTSTTTAGPTTTSTTSTTTTTLEPTTTSTTSTTTTVEPTTTTSTTSTTTTLEPTTTTSTTTSTTTIVTGCSSSFTMINCTYDADFSSMQINGGAVVTVIGSFPSYPSDPSHSFISGSPATLPLGGQLPAGYYTIYFPSVTTTAIGEYIYCTDSNGATQSSVITNGNLSITNVYFNCITPVQIVAGNCTTTTTTSTTTTTTTCTPCDSYTNNTFVVLTINYQDCTGTFYENALIQPNATICIVRGSGGGTDWSQMSLTSTNCGALC